MNRYKKEENSKHNIRSKLCKISDFDQIKKIKSQEHELFEFYLAQIFGLLHLKK